MTVKLLPFRHLSDELYDKLPIYYSLMEETPTSVSKWAPCEAFDTHLKRLDAPSKYLSGLRVNALIGDNDEQ